MNLPFSHSQFLDVFAAYNQTLWPAAALLWGATAFLVVFWLRRGAAANPAIAWLLVVHWAWSGAVYHLLFFRSINPAAAGFALLFLLQAGLFGWYAWRGGQLRFERSGSAMHRVGLVLVGYSLLYPLLGLAFGLAYPRLPTFGVPCPTTLFTAGFLLLAPASLPRKLFIIPVLWALVGGSAAVLLHISADFALLAAGALLLARLLFPGKGVVPARAALLALALLPPMPTPSRAASPDVPRDPASLEAFLDGLVQAQLRERRIAGVRHVERDPPDHRAAPEPAAEVSRDGPLDTWIVRLRERGTLTGPPPVPPHICPHCKGLHAS